MKHTVQFLSCVLSETTATDAEGRWKDSDRVRWVDHIPEKIGGWQKLKLGSGANATIKGLARSTLLWSDLTGEEWIAFGTHKTLDLYSAGVLYDITPVRATHNPVANAISTSSTGAYDPASGGDAKYFKVTDTGHGAQVGDIVNLSGVAAVGGITPAGDYEVRTVIDANNYVLRHTSVATSTVNNGGGAATIIVYYLAAGREVAGVGTGYGLGSWNTGAYGTPRSGSSQISQPRTWCLDHWGEDLLAVPAGGGLYWWDRTGGGSSRATLISQAPQIIDRMIVSQEDRHVIALGCSDPGGGSNYDPLSVRWSNDGDYTVWTAAPSNSAGQERCSTGSYILQAVRTAYGTLIFTDRSLHLLTFVGPPDYFSLRQIADNVRLIGPNAAIDAGGVVYAMGKHHFYRIDSGVVTAIPCEIRDKVYLDTQTLQGYQVTVSYLDDFGEVRWEITTSISSQNARYIVYNINEPGWYAGTMARSVMGPPAMSFADSPYGVDCGGVGISDDNQSQIFVHETGSDDDVNPMNEFMESFDWQLPDAVGFIAIDGVWPDFKVLQGAVTFTFKSKDRSQQPSYRQKVYPGITGTTEKVSPRLRGQQIAWEVSSSALGTFWRMGMPEVEYEIDGAHP